MKIMSRSKLAKEKIRNIEAGFSAFAETEELTALIRKEISELNLDVIEEETEFGSWFIPKKRA
ncbi:hypothetical protein CR205_01035 [Alteribacter lacisalsi]|jgi:hypothetical protein|uniref:Uncharacterized protein n=1 Tax=Alteribacter lacisalsi TaxID=2045244 RepID=A0A2W0HUA3_9BACI|nr:hypothetical protein [Alteribacter lacisalsi]PYZ97218.1 hypothetical protein CR205_01035 [Alteribacter lacisalsi]